MTAARRESNALISALRRRPRAGLLVAAVCAAGAAAVVLGGCPGNGSCSSSSDCADFAVCVSGRCTPANEVDAGAGDAGAHADGGNTDAGGSGDAGEVGDAGDLDGGAGADAGDDAGMVDGGYCAYDAGNPANLLFNPGFECGVPPDGWIPFGDAQLATVSALAYDGVRAARLMSLDGGTMSLFPETPPVTGGAGIKTYCASSYVNGTPGKTVRISVQAYGLGGGVNEATFSAPLAGGWERIDIGAKTTINDDKVTLRVWMPVTTAGEQLLIDDAQLWVSEDGGCRER